MDPVRIRILDLDGSLASQPDLFAHEATDWVAGEGWGPKIRLACTFGTFRRFADWLPEKGSPNAPPPTPPYQGGEPEDSGDPTRHSPPATFQLGAPILTFYGSGDFHHVTLALLSQFPREPFNLLVLDKHPDWMCGIPFLHCGTWLHHALCMPQVGRVFHVGGETDFDNAYRWLAPWREISSGRVVVIPARRRFACGRWASHTVRPLLEEDTNPSEVLSDVLCPFRDDLRSVPLYISIDKDVLTAEDAAVNWDSGLLRLPEAVAVVEAFLEAAEGRLAGADVLGDWSPVVLGGALNRLCHRLDHPSPTLDPMDAATRNRRANAAFLRVLMRSRSAC